MTDFGDLSLDDMKDQGMYYCNQVCKSQVVIDMLVFIASHGNGAWARYMFIC